MPLTDLSPPTLSPPDRADVTIRAYSAVLGETLTIRGVPAEWVPLIRAVEATGCTVYGPDYSRAVVETLVDLRYLLRDGCSVVAWDRLAWACRRAGVPTGAAS